MKLIIIYLCILMYDLVFKCRMGSRKCRKKLFNEKQNEDCSNGNNKKEHSKQELKLIQINSKQIKGKHKNKKLLKYRTKD